MSPEGTKRKLTAILSADVKGYSRLMEDDEEATVSTLTAYKQVMTEVIEKHRGRVVDSPGDNLLAEFASVVDAMRGAVEIQEELRARNSELPDRRRMEFRIGINLGDVIEEEGCIYGDGVNIAARLETLAEGGGICISGTVHDQVKNKVGLEFQFLGEKSVKNLLEPIRAYRVAISPGAVAHRTGESASVAKMAFPLPDKPSIAVLPFVNMSEDPKQEYFSDGITEQIITSISKLPRLFVISRTSSFKYKGNAVDVKQVGRELGVKYVLEGSVQRSGDRLRITAQLIDAITGEHLWAERYDRSIQDIFALQDEITMEIMRSLAMKLTEGEQVRLRRGRTDNLRAFEKVLEGVTYIRAFNIESNATARRLGEEAIALDPEFGAAYTLLASTHFMDVHLGSSKSPRESLGQATKLLQKVIALDENYSDAHALLGHVYALQRQYEKAIAEGEQAVALNPNSDTALVWLAITMRYVGRPEEAIALHKKAMRLCPFPPAYYYLNLGNAYATAERYKEAITEYKKALHLRSNDVFSFIGLAICHSLLGEEEEARAAVAELLTINPNMSIKGHTKIQPYKDQALKERWRDALLKAGAPE
jgi:adenylate cyclase